MLNPKEDLHGLGYDPYKHAPEFRGTFCLNIEKTLAELLHSVRLSALLISEKKRSRMSKSREMGHRQPQVLKDSLFGFKCKIYSTCFQILGLLSI